jgi:uncharacterized peroxidase-related enzyme
MAHIELPEGIPGILGPMAIRPETAVHLNGLAETLLRGPSTLTSGERELIAARVSHGNACTFCHMSHGAAAAAHLDGDEALVQAVKEDPGSADISPKLRALLAIADQVRVGGQAVTAEAVEAARAEGATDIEIHDAVLIAAAFSMFNRYVDGLGTWQPEGLEAYRPMGERLASIGYGTSLDAIRAERGLA